MKVKPDIENLKKYLQENGIQPSIQRIKILEYLATHKTHPTADMIYQAISKDIPTLSKTTIYNTLKTFLEKGIVRGLTIEENEVRYDLNTEPHAHFKCIKCGNVYDLEVNSPLLCKEEIDGHRVIECHIYIKGICKHCLK